MFIYIKTIIAKSIYFNVYIMCKQSINIEAYNKGYTYRD